MICFITLIVFGREEKKILGTAVSPIIMCESVLMLHYIVSFLWFVMVESSFPKTGFFFFFLERKTGKLFKGCKTISFLKEVKPHFPYLLSLFPSIPSPYVFNFPFSFNFSCYKPDNRILIYSCVFPLNVFCPAKQSLV